MKINIKRANWKSNELFMGEKANITTLVIEQNGIVIDPSDNDFLGAVFKQYVLRKLGKEEFVALNLSASDLFFYGENANVYLLNYIYSMLFPDNPLKPFDPILQSDEGEINIGLFNCQENQIVYLVEILHVLAIDFNEILDKYMVFPFPRSLEYYDKERISDLIYKNLEL